MRIAIPNRDWLGFDDGRRREFNGRLGWLGKWLFETFSAPSTRTEETIKTVEIDTGSIIEAIHKCQHAVDMIWNKELAYVVVGPDAFNELLYENDRRLANCLPPMNMSVNMRIGFGSDGVRVFGVPVKFVPWFTGVLCVPK